MKKITAVMAAMVCIASLTGCGSTDLAPASTSASTQQASTSTQQASTSTQQTGTSAPGSGSSTGTIAPTGVVSLGWDPVPMDLSGYRVHYGKESGKYAYSVEAGKSTNFVVKDLPPGTYYFAVTAYDASGVESSYSNEVSSTVTAGS